MRLVEQEEKKGVGTYLLCPFLLVLFMLLEDSGDSLLVLLSLLRCTYMVSCGYRGGKKKSQSGGWVQAQWRGHGRLELQRGESGLPIKNGFSWGINSRGSSLNLPAFGDPPS